MELHLTELSAIISHNIFPIPQLKVSQIILQFFDNLK